MLISVSINDRSWAKTKLKAAGWVSTKPKQHELLLNLNVSMEPVNTLLTEANMDEDAH